jgi:hypothetical protein
MPDHTQISVFPKVGSKLQDLFLLNKLKNFDPSNFYLKPNKLFSEFTEDHKLTTINLISRIRGGSGELDALKKRNREIEGDNKTTRISYKRTGGSVEK